MTPANFAAAYGATARAVSDGTGIDSAVLLAQWANETAWGTIVVGNNLGNIRCSPTTFCKYATLQDFAAACVATFHNGLYGPVLAAKTPQAQLAAIVASPWSAGHYGGSLTAFYDPLEAYEMTPAEDSTLNAIYAIVAGSRLPSKAVDQAVTDIEKEVKALAIPAPTPVDLQPVLTAIANVQTALVALQTAVTAIKAKTDKDLA
jgi:hypothetical protein